MEEFRHIDPLALQSTELTDRTPFCPDDLLISEYFDGVIPDRERQKMEHHLADCRYCMARIGMLNRQQDDTPAGDVPGQVLADAKALAKNAASRRPKKAPAWATAAVVVLGVFFFTLYQQPNEPEPPQLRNIDRTEHSFEVFLPGPGYVVSPGSPIRWTELSANSHYTVYVLSDAGDVLWTEHLQHNEWTLQDQLQLDPDGVFFFRVEAELPDGSIVSSNHLALRLDRQ
mgnify:CR=1 FL=1